MATLWAHASCSQQPTMKTWDYGEFMQAVEDNKIEAVDIDAYPDHYQATVTTQEGESISVRLPNDPKLLNILTQKKVVHSVQPHRSKGLFLFRRFAILLIPGVAFLFWIWVLIDCATKEASEGNTKVVWVIIILFLNLIGALVYFSVRRPQRRRELRQ